MEQTLQPGDQKKNLSNEKPGTYDPETSADGEADQDKHVIPSGKKIDISDEDRALDSGI
jgi:hypothetical protein